jgi:hypothetical protein
MGGPTGLYLGAGVQLIEEGHNIYWSREDGEIQADFLTGDPWISRTGIHDGSWASSSGQGDGNITADPLFHSGWPEVDLGLNPSSPAIDRGASLNAPLVDCLGNARPFGNTIDIGAYEFRDGTSVRNKRPVSPVAVHLYPPVPNPCNRRLLIRYTLNRSAPVQLNIFDHLGRCRGRLFEGHQETGDYVYGWDALNEDGKPLPSGLYIVLLRAGHLHQTGKFILLK